MEILERVNRLVWGAPMIVLILSVGLVLTVKTGFVQLRLFPAALKCFFQNIFRKESGKRGVSSFQALCTALAATVGTGNIAGVAGAIAIGGPGAIFWMWICGLLGMILKYAEATLAVRYQVIGSDGQLFGGPMYMIRQGMGDKWKWLASLYCFFGVVAAFGVGNATQINAVVDGIRSAVNGFGGQWDPGYNLVLGIVLSGLVLGMLLGGARRIGNIAEKLVPFVSVAYILMGLGVLLLRLSAVPEALRSIIQGAFSPGAVTGGAVGSFFTSLRTGVSRGVFTNEAGMGTAAIAYGGADTDHPAKQGLMGIVEVFVDTMVICTITSLVILCSDSSLSFGLDEGAAITARAFSSVYGRWASVLLAFFLSCFAFATLLGWGLYGTRCAQFLFGNGAWKPFAYIQAAVSLFTAMIHTGTVWMLAETVNGLMAVPNLIALAVLCPELICITKDYFIQFGRNSAGGGTYESFYQCKPLRTFSHEKIPSACGGGRAPGKENPSPEHRSA